MNAISKNTETTNSTIPCYTTVQDKSDDQKERMPTSGRRITIDGVSRYVLGSGSYGVVYSLDMKSVYKSCSVNNIEWIKEVLVTRHLQTGLHPSIIKYDKVELVPDYKFDTDNKKYFRQKINSARITMKYYNSTMYDVTYYTDVDIVIILNNLASAIAYTHSKNVIHRDIKESNILLEFNEACDITGVVLCDYGLGKYAIEADLDPDYEMVTISHRPPELEMSLKDASYITNYYKKMSKICEGDPTEGDPTEGDPTEGDPDIHPGDPGDPTEGEPDIHPGDPTEGDPGDFVFKYDSRVDVWSFGMVVVYMVTGRSFYAYIELKGLSFSNIIRNPIKTYEMLNTFLKKYTTRNLEHIDFYIEVINHALKVYENRNSMNEIFTFINKYLEMYRNNSSIECAYARGKIHPNPLDNESQSQLHLPYMASSTHKRVTFAHSKKNNINILINALIKEKDVVRINNKFIGVNLMDFTKIFTEVNIQNPGLFMAMNNLYAHLTSASVLEKIEKMSETKIDNISTFLPVCYAITSIVLVDRCFDDPVIKCITNNKCIINLIFQVLESLDYNIINLFGFHNPLRSRPGQVPSEL